MLVIAANAPPASAWTDEAGRIGRRRAQWDGPQRRREARRSRTEAASPFHPRRGTEWPTMAGLERDRSLGRRPISARIRRRRAPGAKSGDERQRAGDQQKRARETEFIATSGRIASDRRSHRRGARQRRETLCFGAEAVPWNSISSEMAGNEIDCLVYASGWRNAAAWQPRRLLHHHAGLRNLPCRPAFMLRSQSRRGQVPARPRHRTAPTCL